VERVTKGKLAYTAEEYRQYVEEDLKLIRKLSPDLMVSDYRVSTPICADLSGVPTIMIANAHFSPYSAQPPAALDSPLVRIIGYEGMRSVVKLFYNTLIKYYAGPFNTVRKSYGLRLLKGFHELHDCIDRCPYWLLYLDIPSLSPTTDIPSNHGYLGPPIWSPDVAMPDWWDDLPSGKPVVYLTLGSSGNLKHMPIIMKVLANKPVTVLFAGSSGPAKTLAASAIAKEAGCTLYRVDLGLLVSKYIGETEKNLNCLFDAAEESDVILLFDEADALFGKRSEVKDSRDRHTNSEVSYLLQRMESFQGLTILSSNMKESIDQAFIRRFSVVVEFPSQDDYQSED